MKLSLEDEARSIQKVKMNIVLERQVQTWVLGRGYEYIEVDHKDDTWVTPHGQLRIFKHSVNLDDSS